MKVLASELVISAVIATGASTGVCDPSTFNNSFDSFQGKVLMVDASALTNVSADLQYIINAYPVNVSGLDICQVSVLYTHPGQNDAINVTLLLPDEWNGRYMAVGGGGFAAESGMSSLLQPASVGFAVSMTDAGHDPNNGLTAPWGLTSPGYVNWNLLLDFTRLAYDDMATLSKSVITAYYGSSPTYSYWNGCSTGGRQGHQMAQSYPTQFNGILATAPAINWASFLVAEYWPQLIMTTLNIYPTQCELNAIVEAAIEACDNLDGIIDGIIMKPGLCDFDPQSVVGQSINCSDIGSNITISSGAAQTISALWAGPNDNGQFEWYGLNPGASPLGLANTTCAGVQQNCTGNPFQISASWIETFLIKDNTTSLQNLSQTDYNKLFRQSIDQYESIISANNPNLADFRDNGGKMITWHGLADQLIPPNGTYNYYHRVLEYDSNAADYYRFFVAPGIAHCFGGSGWFPGDTVQSLMDWVENGTAPDILEARTVFNPGDASRSANLCAYPKEMAYTGGDGLSSSSFTCQ